MKTNFQMLRELNDWSAKKFGFLNEDEVNHLRNTLNIESRSNVELQNLRDFVVVFYSLQQSRLEDTDDVLVIADKMSAICGVIDEEKFNRGMDV